MSPQAALDRVCSLCDVVIPNRLMILFIDEILGLEDELINVVHQHYSKFPLVAGPPLVLLVRPTIDE